MSKICETCKSVKTCFSFDEENPSITYLCKNIKYKRKFRDDAILNGNQNAINLTDADLKKYPISTNCVTNKCEFFKAKKDE